MAVDEQPTLETTPVAAATDVAAKGAAVPHAEKAWEFFRSMGSPKFHVAPMVDQSELPFRRLCRKYGATCAYTPMIHARLFCGDPKYRAENFATCEGDRPLLAQFCANDPNYLVQAANIVAPHVDGVDINFGCPQRIAKRGYYGAFLMDDLQLVKKLVTSLVAGCSKPVTCKIRVFPKLEDTLAYAKMIESAGCMLLAVHGRTREQKCNSSTRADWDQIKAVKQALSIPVLANGNIRHLQDALDCMAYTGADGVLSAESLLEDPALFSPQRLLPGGARRTIDGVHHSIEYLKMCQETPPPFRMVRGHIFRMCGPWLSEHVDLRSQITGGVQTVEAYLAVVEELTARIQASGRDEPKPAISAKQLEKQAKEAARKAAIEEQEREAAALQALQPSNTNTDKIVSASAITATVQSTEVTADIVENGGKPEAVQAAVVSTATIDVIVDSKLVGNSAGLDDSATRVKRHKIDSHQATMDAIGSNGCTDGQ